MELFERIVAIILPVFLIVAVGYAYARWRGEAVKVQMAAVNALNIGVLCPLLVFSALAGKDFDLARNSTLVLAGVAISLGSGLLAWPVARLLGYDVRSFVPPMMYNNCGNMGLPLAVLAFGTAGLPGAVAMFVACNLVYFSIGIKIIEMGRQRGRRSWFAFMADPMMIAAVLGMGFSLAQIALPASLLKALSMLGDACIPIMLFALGVRMLDVSLKSWRIGLAGAIVCPVAGLLVALLLDAALTLTPMQRGQMYMFAALPPAVFCFVVAEQYQQEPGNVAAIVLLGNLAALLFLPVGLWLGLHAA